MIYKFLGILLVLFFSLEINVSAQSISDIKKQKAKTEKEIAYLNSLLKEAEKNKSVSTQKLNILRQKIQQSKKLLSSLNQEVGLIQNNISANEQRIKELEENKKSMLDLYAKLVYGSWKKRNKTDKLMFIFSSADFNQAYNRFKYFQQIQEYSKRQLHMIQAVNDSLDVKNKELKDLFAQKNTALNEIGVQSKELESEQLKENQYIAQIQKKEKDYNDLVQKRKSATLTSPYSGTVAEITDSIGDEASGENIMLIRDKKDFLLSAEDASGLRYNMTVDVGLGATLDSIKYHLKGKVISTDNLQQDLQDGNDNGGEQQNESGGAQLIRLSKKDRESYQFSKYNIYITGVSLKIEDALLVDADAVYEETENEEIKNFVYLVENGKLHKRYIVSNYKQEKTYLVNQGLEEGQTLAIVSK